MRVRLFFTGLFSLILFFSPDQLPGQNSYSFNNMREMPDFNTRISKYLFSSGNSKKKKNREKIPFKITWEIADTFRVDVRRSMLLAKGYGQMAERGIMSFYELSGELTVDGNWIESHDHFAVWDSKKVNPYDFDPTKYKESITVALKDKEDLWISPMKNSSKVNSKFGMRRYRWHHGVDLDLERGEPVRAVADGIVRVARYDRYGYGHYVVLRHKNGLETLYGHFLKKIVRVGQEVKRGDIIGLGGSTGRSTGYHLHFEVRYKGVAVDPTQLYDFQENQLKDANLDITSQTFAYVKELQKKRYHRIRSGDTLGRISRKYRTTIGTLCRLNSISRNKILRIGRMLRVR